MTRDNPINPHNLHRPDMTAMILAGRKYIETQPKLPEHSQRGVCAECALGQAGMLKQCAAAVLGEAEKAFGGDCETRDVIYAEMPK